MPTTWEWTVDPETQRRRRTPMPRYPFRHLVRDVAQADDLSQADAERVIRLALGRIGAALAESRTVYLPGVGRLVVNPRRPGWCFAARMPARRDVVFRGAGSLKTRMKRWLPRWHDGLRAWERLAPPPEADPE